MSKSIGRPNRWRWPVLVAAAAGLCYLPAVWAGFVFDDWILLVQHPIIHAADGLHRIWCTAEAPDYYPVAWSALWLQWHLWGASPANYHIVNLILHALNALLLGVVLEQLAVRAAWPAALVFAVHPTNAFTVAWIIEQKNTIAMLGFLACVWAYLRYDDENRWPWYMASLACFVVSLLAKPAAAMGPFILLGIAWWRRRRVTTREIGNCLPFFLLAAASGVLAVWFQAERVLGGEPARTDGLLSRLVIAGWALWFYLGKILAPLGLCMIYPRWQPSHNSAIPFLPLALFIAVLGLGYWMRKSWGRPLLAGLGFFTLMLFPVLGFFDQGFYRYSFVAIHWLYLPSVGVIALVCAMIDRLRSGATASAQRNIQLLGAALIAILGLKTWSESRVFLNDETLWQDTVAQNPSAWLAQYNLGVQAEQQGQLPEAIAYYQTTLRIKPDDTYTRNNMAAVLAKQGKLAEAMALWQTTLRYRPDDIVAHNNLGVAYAQQSNFKEAELHFSLVLLVNPGDVEAHANLGSIYASAGKLTKAIDQYQAALRTDPQMTSVKLNLAVLWVRCGHAPEAIQLLEDILKTDPSNRDAESLLAQLRRRAANDLRSSIPS